MGTLSINDQPGIVLAHVTPHEVKSVMNPKRHNRVLAKVPNFSGPAESNVIDFDFAGSSHGWVKFCRSPWQTDMAQYSERKLTEVRFIDK